MEPKTKKKSPIAIIIASVVTLAVAVGLIVFFITRNSGEDPINDAYFKSNDKRLVYTTEIKDRSENYNATKIHEVYKIDGETVKNYSFFYEYQDEYSANKALENVRKSVWNDEDVTTVELYGKFIGIVYDDEKVEKLTASDIREDISRKEAYDRGVKNNDNIGEKEF